MAGNNNNFPNGGLNGFPGQNASSSTISSRSTISQQSNTTNNTANTPNHLLSMGMGLGGNNNNNNNNPGQQNNGGNAGGTMAGQSSIPNNNNNNPNNPGISMQQMSSMLQNSNLLQNMGMVGALNGHQPNNGNNNNNGGNNNNPMLNGAGSSGPAGFNGLNTNMFNGASQVAAGIPAMGDISMGNGGGIGSTASEIQKFAEQSRNHGKMIEFFIEHHLPPLMKTDKLIKELGKMDFDTFQTNYGNNPNLMENNFGFEFDHLKNNNNGLPSLENDSDELRREKQQLTNNLNNANQQIARLQNDNDQKQREIDQLRNRNRSLEQRVQELQNQLMRLNGGSPRFQLVKYTERKQIDSIQFYESTQTVNEFKQEIVRRKGINAENWNIEADKEFNDYLDGVLVYLNHNEDCSNGIGVCNGGGSSNDDAKNTYISQKDVIEKYCIINNQRVPSLNGSNGLRAKQKIFAKTVIGQYFGTEYMSEEFERVFANTKEYPLKCVFAYKLDVVMPKPKDGENPNVNVNVNGNNNEKWIGNKPYSVIIDAYVDSKPCHLLTNINDCRKNINMNDMTQEDRSHENIKFVKVFVDGWPMVFAVACKDIEQGQELLAYYGKDFCLAVQGNMGNFNMNNINNNNSNNMNNMNNMNMNMNNNMSSQPMNRMSMGGMNMNNNNNNSNNSNNVPNNTNEDLDLTNGGN